MSEELFNEFLSNRAEMFGKKINTKRSVKSLVKKLEGWRVMGYNTDAILQHAIDVGWRGLFLPQGMEPKQSHLKAPKHLPGVGHLIQSTRIPRSNYAEKQKRAETVRQDGRDALAKMRSLLG